MQLRTSHFQLHSGKLGVNLLTTEFLRNLRLLECGISVAACIIACLYLSSIYSLMTLTSKSEGLNWIWLDIQTESRISSFGLLLQFEHFWTLSRHKIGILVSYLAATCILRSLLEKISPTWIVFVLIDSANLLNLILVQHSINEDFWITFKVDFAQKFLNQIFFLLLIETHSSRRRVYFLVDC